MYKKFVLFVCGGFLAMNLCGCLALMAGVAGGAGTAVWLSGKLSQEFHSPYENTITAAKSALASLDLTVTKETHSDKVDQLRGTYKDGREFWVDVRKVTDQSTKVEVRVGVVHPDKEATTAILKAVEANL